MKEFFNDCLFFRSKDKGIKVIGIIIWISLLGMTILLYSFFKIYLSNGN